MDYQTTDEWKEALWLSAEEVYEEAFPEHGRKNRAVVRRMFERRLCTLHVWSDRGAAAAMALTAYDARTQWVVIDYLAVRRSSRRNGIGSRCLADMRSWAAGAIEACRGLIIEVEAEETVENANRIRFWEQAGFRLTDYVHAYIWVPETYRAMYLPFGEEWQQEDGGKALFKAITRYHEKAYRARSQP
ncbi:GNAT family N-acetyltransferase [Paenibacillus sacheonensis]|uniref:GNAT family N-acetyltransferase n=1 Tax=Paenibacillus sacheonensis TaxID=742054 RepID=A0A7X4YMW5_9BACL|nr:GNAT family N-acetyltransferase [Paenibacillus sacheonensis]MBM7563125.1 GNAT superfamily N-acetyltransferase [Paenibacillus sacheonensis]NBC68309.1 GNAT family N-acetyltransferase [Paenibacillus sacheonensis]